MWKKVLLWVVIGGAAAALLIQVIPYGRDHSAPPTTKEAPWDSPRTKELADGACFDCHSNQTEWPWYSHVAPLSWMLYRDVSRGRSKLDFSDWKDDSQALAAAADVQSRRMPPSNYKMLHPLAQLTDAQSAELAAGFKKMAGQ